MIYKMDRLTHSLADFAKLVELFRPALGAVRFRDPVIQYDEQHGRLTLNVLLSFAQFEREVIASGSGTRLRLQGQGHLGGRLGAARLSRIEKKLVVLPEEAGTVRLISDATLKSARSEP